MYELGVVYRNITRADRAATDGLAALGSATVHEAMGRVGLMKPYMRPIYAGAHLCGTAVTVLLHPGDKPKVSYVARQLEPHPGPVVASTDYMKAYAEQIRPFIPKGRTYKVLGTDGFGRSDFRSKLREHFEVNRHYIVVAALKALSEDGVVPATKVAEAIAKYNIQADKVNPLYA